MSQGIEIFGRRATVVGPSTATEPRRRSVWLGLAALSLAVATVVLTALGVGAAAAGDEAAAQWVAVAAIGGSILSTLISIVAIVTGRGRALAARALPLALMGNPWILTRVLEFFSRFVG